MIFCSIHVIVLMFLAFPYWCNVYANKDFWIEFLNWKNCHHFYVVPNGAMPSEVAVLTTGKPWLFEFCWTVYITRSDDACTCVLGKLFTRLLNNRLDDWAEKYRIYIEAQNGFRRGRGTVDSAFILSNIISSFLENGKKLYAFLWIIVKRLILLFMIICGTSY